MSKNTAKIKEGLLALTEQPLDIISGTVVPGSTDADALTISVLPANSAAPIPGVMLGTATENDNGLILFPADDSQVVITSRDGGGEWCLLKAGNLERAQIKIGSSLVTITDGQIQFNDGSLGGLTKTHELKTQLDKTTTLLQHLIAVINGPPVAEAGSGAPSALQASLHAAITSDSPGDFSGIENTAIKQ